MPRLTEEDLKLRRTFLGASDISAVVGLNPFKGPVDVLNEKRGYTVTQARQTGDFDPTEIGHRLEPVIAGMYEEYSGHRTLGSNSVVLGWMGASPDRIVPLDSCNNGLEIKYVGHRMAYDWDISEPDGYPSYVRCQAAWQRRVCGFESVDIAALIGTEFGVWTYERDDEFETMLVDTGKAWWDKFVVGGADPAVDGGDAVRTYLDGKYPGKDRSIQCEADIVATGAASAALSLRGARDSAAEEYKACINRLIEWTGKFAVTDIVGDGWKFTYRMNKNGERRPSLTSK